MQSRVSYARPGKIIGMVSTGREIPTDILSVVQGMIAAEWSVCRK
jgi:hypothetical protein